MKQMQDFHNALFSKSESIVPHKNLLAGLTRLSRSRLANASYDPWFMWNAEAAG